jgi:hypothetical protein
VPLLSVAVWFHCELDYSYVFIFFVTHFALLSCILLLAAVFSITYTGYYSPSLSFVLTIFLCSLYSLYQPLLQINYSLSFPHSLVNSTHQTQFILHFSQLFLILHVNKMISKYQSYDQNSFLLITLYFIYTLLLSRFEWKINCWKWTVTIL